MLGELLAELRREDAAAAVAELILYVERRAAQQSSLVGTVGMLDVPAGSINVVRSLVSARWTCERAVASGASR